MKRMKLTKYEQTIEGNIDKYVPVSKQELNEIVRALDARKKDAILNIRINKYDLDNLKQKARKMGVKYQTLIGEILHKVAQAQDVGNMREIKNIEKIKQRLKDLMRLRIRSLQGEMQQFTRNPAFLSNIKIVNSAIIESEIAALQKFLDAI